MKKAILIIFLFAAAVAAALQSFNAGELSPRMKYRLDIEKRGMGVEQLDNFTVKVQGAALRRPGTLYVAEANDVNSVRLIPFEYAATDAYVLEMGHNYLRFYRDE